MTRTHGYDFRPRPSNFMDLERYTARDQKLRTGRSYTKTQTKKKSKQGRAVTSQKDFATRYVRRRMPARRRKKWVSFVRKVDHVALQSQPLQVYQSLAKQGFSTGVGEQFTTGVLLKDVGFTNQSDLPNIFKDAYGGAGAVTDYDGRRIYLKAAVLDLQIKNTGTEQCIVDVYRIVCRKPNSTVYSGMDALWNDVFGDSAIVGAVSAANAALTPFDVPSFCKYWLIKSKQEFIVSADQVITMQIRDPKNRMLQGRRMQNTSGGLPGITEGFLIQYRGVPENTVATSGLTAASVAWSSQTTYHYAKPPGEQQEVIGQSK